MGDKRNKFSLKQLRERILTGISPALAWAMCVGLFIGIGFGLTSLILIFYKAGVPVTLLAVSIITTVVAVASVIIAGIIAVIKRMRWQLIAVLCFVFILLMTTMHLALYIVPALIGAMVAVYLAIMFATGRIKGLRRPIKWLLALIMTGGGVGAVALLLVLIYPGPALTAADRPEQAQLALPYTIAPIQNVDRDIKRSGLSGEDGILEDPSQPGDYQYSVYYYATPDQKIEPYPDQTTLASVAVDSSFMLSGWSVIRRLQYGFTEDDLPLNGQVWMPEGDGPFPLTLIVHGNHEATDRSDGGYAYLGELLASRGIIAVSVDENFLNSSAFYDLIFFDGLSGENDARALVLLEHLMQWYNWNKTTDHPFYQMVDFENIALIGHSRGGEAVALAAVFADLQHYPDNGRLAFDYPFEIKTVAAIAPVHRQYDPAGLEASLTGVNYLVLHGEHDMDVTSFQGANMYRRTDVSAQGVKAQVWIQYANHGQFNSSWGASDQIGLVNMGFNSRLMMPMEEQQQAAKVFIGAFMEMTLHDREEYRTLFRDFTYGADWLPAAHYVTDYADGNHVMLDNFDDSFDISRSVSGETVYVADGFSRWTMDYLPGKSDNSNRVLILSWTGDDGQGDSVRRPPVFKTKFGPTTVAVGDTLYMSLCAGNDSIASEVSFRVILTDSSGRSVVRSIDDFGGVTVPLAAPIAKPLFADSVTSEPVLQMVAIKTDRFEGLTGNIITMEWIMDRNGESSETTTLYVDDLRIEQYQ
ncbi:MAG: hypothetical protein LBV33_04995 [Lachnospiraceae bacterium]|nr:hypothetical protein [Lachnospiraceae bacterium]